MEDEIDLVSYIRVILKRRWIIIVVALIVMVGGWAFTLLMPKSYRISTILEIGKIGEFIPETPIQLQEKINQGSYNEMVKEELSLSRLPRLEATVPEDTNLVIIEVFSRDSQKEEEVVKTLSNVIIKEHEELFTNQRKFIEGDIKKEEAKISILEKSQSLPELQYLYVEHLSRIDELKKDLTMATPTRLIKSPSRAIISPGITTNIVVAGFLGILMGFLIAFFKDFWDKNREKLKG